MAGVYLSFQHLEKQARRVHYLMVPHHALKLEICSTQLCKYDQFGVVTLKLERSGSVGRAVGWGSKGW